MTSAVLSLGSNLGDRAAHLRAAVAGLGDAVLIVSGVYENPPWGDPGQPDYLNAAVYVVDSTATARDWLSRAQALECSAGRARDPARPFGPRTLDVDVIAVWDAAGEPVVVDGPDLVVPHPRAHQRAFVLRPWLDIQPYGQFPGRGPLRDVIGFPGVVDDLAALRPVGDVTLDGVDIAERRA